MSDTYYHFLSSLRQGLAASIDAPATGKRAEVELAMQVARRRLGSGQWVDNLDPIRRTVQLYGPGDIAAFDDRMIVRTDPKPDSGNFEPNYFPAVEFADPDFPWRFSPAPAEPKGLTPWITLIVLVAEDRGENTRREFEELPRGRNQRPAIRVSTQTALPNLEHGWRWAHVQATAGVEDLIGDRLKELSPAELAALKSADKEAMVAAELDTLYATKPELVVSRLLCARRLQPKTLYRALIVPTYKLGWAAGLDTPAANTAAEAGDPAAWAWNNTSDDPVDLPYYHHWEFRTSARGDFEYLVRLLEPRALIGLGKREIDCERPGFGLSMERLDNEGKPTHLLEMEGALQSLNTAYTLWGKDRNGPVNSSVIEGESPPPAPPPEEFQEELAEKVLIRADVQPRIKLPDEFTKYVVSEDTLGDPRAVIDGLTFVVMRDGTSVEFTLSTSNPTTAILDYGAEDDAGGFSYSRHAVSDSLTTTHAVTATLVPEKAYHFRFRIQNGTVVTTPDATITVPLPTIVPPIYGRWHAAREAVFADTNHNEWLDVLNLDPRHRAAAGLGSEVVRKQQEALMASAWDQIGAVEAANDVLRRAQLGREGSIYLYQRFADLALEDFFRLTQPVQKRITREEGVAGKRTVRTELMNETRLPAAALSPALRRIARPRGRLRRIQYSQGVKTSPQTHRTDMLRRVLSGQLRAAGPHPRLVGTTTPCDVTKRAYQQFQFDALQEGGTVGDGVTVGWDGTVSPNGGVSGATGIWPTPEIITVPANAQRFCDDRIDCEQLHRAFKNGVEGVDKDNAFAAVCDALDGFLLPPATTAEKPARNEDYLVELRTDIESAINPRITIVSRTKHRLRLQRSLAARFDEGAFGDPLDELMAYPEFPQPMYEPLRGLSQSHVLPGIEKIPQNTIGLLKPNRRFVESYMIGLNHEMAGELLWRRYPTDQRGSYFRQFWDVDEYVPSLSELDLDGNLNEDTRDRLKDIAEIHLWGKSGLSKNRSQSDEDDNADEEAFLVLIIRGDLLKRYPNALIYAVDALEVEAAEGQPATLMPKLAEFGQTAGDPIFPIFRGSLGADLVFMGFPFDDSIARSSKQSDGSYDNTGKYIVFEERITEARFGLDSATVSVPWPVDPPHPTDPDNPIVPDGGWDGLHWGHFQLAETDRSGRFLDGSDAIVKVVNERWNADTDAAMRARITLQKPARLVVHADQMMPLSTS